METVGLFLVSTTLAGGQGFEPQLMVPETIVLPIKLSPSIAPVAQLNQIDKL